MIPTPTCCWSLYIPCSHTYAQFTYWPIWVIYLSHFMTSPGEATSLSKWRWKSVNQHQPPTPSRTWKSVTFLRGRDASNPRFWLASVEIFTRITRVIYFHRKLKSIKYYWNAKNHLFIIAEFKIQACVRTCPCSPGLRTVLLEKFQY